VKLPLPIPTILDRTATQFYYFQDFIPMISSKFQTPFSENEVVGKLPLCVLGKEE
jgi:hypothetical protein